MHHVSNYRYGSLLILLVVSLIFCAAYSVFRISYFLFYPNLADQLFALLFLFAELFIVIHSIGYLFNILHVVKYHHSLFTPKKGQENLTLTSYPPVAIVVASYKEPLDILKDTLICLYNLTYPNKQLFLLDDTRYDQPWDTPEKVEAYKKSIEELCQWLNITLFRHKWHDAKAGLINDFLQFLQHKPVDCSVSPYAQLKEQAQYLIIFDVDMNPFPNFVEPLVSLMNQYPRLAFIQTPQYYTNFSTNRVARASGLMQAVFYEFICEAKGLENSMFCCGTNVLFRLKALYEVEGFVYTSVTEDFATSFIIHSRKWNSDYLNKPSAFGLGPEDLACFFKQQYRWAQGTMSLFRTLLIEFVKNPRLFSSIRWWQYFLSGTYYFIGWVFFILLLGPVAFLLFNVPTYFAQPLNYFIFFIPYLVISNLLFYWTLAQRRYFFSDLFSGVLLISITFPVYMRAAVSALLGIHAKFVVTPKDQTQQLSFTDIWPQVLAALICFAAIVWGGFRLYYEQELFYAILINMIWCSYYFGVLSTIFYFNNPVKVGEIRRQCA